MVDLLAEGVGVIGRHAHACRRVLHSLQYDFHVQMCHTEFMCVGEGVTRHDWQEKGGELDAKT